MRSLPVAVGLFACLLAGCGASQAHLSWSELIGPSAPEPAIAYDPFAGRGHDGHVRVSRLARAFLLPRARAPEGFEVYLYVLFDRAQARTEEVRLATCTQMVRLFHHLARLDPSRATPADMALILMPLTDGAETEALRSMTDDASVPRVLLQAYDYVRASEARAELQRGRSELDPEPLPGVALVITSAPLRIGEPLPEIIHVSDLTAVGPERMESYFRELERRLLHDLMLGEMSVAARIIEFAEWVDAWVQRALQ